MTDTRIPSPERLAEIAALARCGAVNRRLAHTALTRESPLLALLAEIEAHADQRIYPDDCALSRLTTIRQLAREAMNTVIGDSPNPIFPRTGETCTDRWERIAADIGEAGHRFASQPEGATS